MIGSGATAVTLVPAMAEKAAHVTMLQRSPTYVISAPGEDPIANALRRFLPPKTAYAIVRWKNVLLQMLVYRLSKRRPNFVRKAPAQGRRRRAARPAMTSTSTSTRSTTRGTSALCLVPDGDLFEAISSGSAEVVTDRIASFTETGIELESGDELEADVIVTATGLNLLFLGGLELSVDGEPVDVPGTLAYKGMMLSDVPNFAFTLGYTNASWTLKADLTSEYMCRLIDHMDANGYTQCVPRVDRLLRRERPGHRPQIGLRAALPRSACRNRAARSPGSCARTTRSTCGRCATARCSTAPCSSRARRAARSRSPSRPSPRRSERRPG